MRIFGHRPPGERLSPLPPKLPLSRLLQRSFLRTALIPLLAVEVILVIAFLVTHQVSTASQVAVQRMDAVENLQRLVQARGESLAQELNSVSIATGLYQQQTAAALRTPAQPSRAEKSRYRKTPAGALVTTQDNGGAAVFYSNLTPVGAKQWQKIWRTTRLDPLMRDLVHTQPLISQIYFNSFDSYNRIYPYMDGGQQYPPDLNIPSYSFYYLADAQHNPEREVVWTDSYLDPAGQGWMVSCIAPVYNGDFLEGVVGSDITLSVLINQVLASPVPWNGYGLLLAKDGTILALPASAEQEWGLREKTNHRYTDFVREDTFKPEEFNLFRRPELANLSQEIQQEFSATQAITLAGTRKLAAWSHIPKTGWTYLVVVPETEIFARTQALGQRLLLLGKVMILGMILFYALFLVYLIRSGRRMSQQVSEPLQSIEALVSEIAAGHYQQPRPEIPIAELDHTAEQVVNMGSILGERSQALVKAIEAKAAFLGVVSHELRTPMNGILGMGELLRLTRLDSTQQHYLNTILSAGNHLLRLLNDILDMSRLEAASLTLVSTEFSLTQMLQETFSLWRNRIQEQGLSLKIELANGLPMWVRADRQRLEQMLNNYLNNALKFTASGGEIRLQVRPADTPDGEAGVQIRFCVSDTGIGIAAVDLEHLFRPFSQVDNSVRRSQEGAGLGLSIVKALAELMGGTVGVTSTPGTGSSFWFQVPLEVLPSLPTAVNPVVTVAPGSPGSVALPRLRVLLAEDNPVNQQFARLCLQRLQVECDTANNGRESVELFAKNADTKNAYDLVLMDISMPEMDGITALHILREINPAVRVVAVTADALPGTLEHLHQEGFDDYLAKPFRLKELQTLLQSMMQPLGSGSR